MLSRPGYTSRVVTAHLGMQMDCATMRGTTLFSNPACITAWRAEVRRVQQKSSCIHKSLYVQQALDLLDDLYCLQNPQHKNPLHVRQAVFALFLEDALNGNPLAMFFEGLARKEGFGCVADISSGHALILVASKRQCAEAWNYLALCYAKHDPYMALTLLRDAAHTGHVQATANFRALAEHVRIQIRRRRKIVELNHPQRLRISV